MPDLSMFTSEHPIYKELDRCGYIPPNCISVSIDLKALRRPIITVTAYASDDLAKFIRRLGEAKVQVEVVGGKGQTGRSGLY